LSYRPGYVALHENGELLKKARELTAMLDNCTLCPRNCKVNRLEGELGSCRAGDQVMISSVFPHFGEEPPLVGYNGSGTIFLTHCNLHCVFCQNFDISFEGRGQAVTTRELAGQMMHLQNSGCHNINLVTPTHYAPQIVSALCLAAEAGLRLPIVYNCGGYESLQVIRLLKGVVDIYMPDVKFAGTEEAEKYCQAPDYPEVIKAVLMEMHRQVGDLTLDGRGIAVKGLLIRHLVMPEGVAGSEELLRFIHDELSPESYVNIMAQYRPCHRANEFPEIGRRLSDKEHREAVALARKIGLHRGF
jgi:putative pyruvate formate lyase activating enzyme